jgi:type II secretory pathway pseudopilin PulG
MSTTEWIILAVVVILALLLIAAILSFSRKRKAEQKRAHAEELRTRAATQAPDLTESQHRAKEAEAAAQLKRAEAERAELEAQRARQGHTVEQARQEDALREADRVDPDVDHTASDYTPSTPPMGTATTEPGTTDTTDRPTGTHRADGTGSSQV